jgi:hypothetical protein
MRFLMKSNFKSKMAVHFLVLNATFEFEYVV